MSREACAAVAGEAAAPLRRIDLYDVGDCRDVLQQADEIFGCLRGIARVRYERKITAN